MRRRNLILALAIGLIIVAGAATVYRIFFIWAVRVPAGSMANTIIPGDHVIVNKSFGKIDRGAIVVFQYSTEYSSQREQYRTDSNYYIARVVGLPGETIQTRGRTVYINDEPIQEQKVIVREDSPYEPLVEISTEGSGPYRVFYTLQSTDEQSAFFDAEKFASNSPFRIPNDSYFVMGDHRDNSEDSRYRGAVPRKLIWGKVSMIYYSATVTSDEPRWERMFKKVH